MKLEVIAQAKVSALGPLLHSRTNFFQNFGRPAQTLFVSLVLDPNLSRTQAQDSINSSDGKLGGAGYKALTPAALASSPGPGQTKNWGRS